MSDNTAPPSPAHDDTDWEAEDESHVWHQWHYALEWARKGDFEPLVEWLRTDLPLNNQEVRNWLADGLMAGDFKKPRKVTKRPQHVPFEMDGRRFYIKQRDLFRFMAMRRVVEIQATEDAAEEDAIDKAAEEHKIKAETLKNWLRRPREHWGLSPAKYDGMFDHVPKKE
jgi:hypothetical protein